MVRLDNCVRYLPDGKWVLFSEKVRSPAPITLRLCVPSMARLLS